MQVLLRYIVAISFHPYLLGFILRHILTAATFLVFIHMY